MSGKRRWSRVLVAVAAVVLAVLGAALGVAVARRQDARAEAVALSQVPDWVATNEVEDAKLLEPPGEQLVNAERALELAPDLEQAHAFRAWVAARLGDLDRASLELDRAGSGLLARRARAIVLFRKGQVEDALALFKERPYDQVLDHFELLCADDRAFQEGTLMHPPPRWPTWWQTILSQEPASVRERLTRIELKAPGSIEALTALRARARIEALEFDDTAAERDIERACAAPPHERALALADRDALVKLVRGSRDLDPVPPLRGAGRVQEQAVWGKLAERVLGTAYEELNRDELYDSNEELDRAERRLLRLVAVVPQDPRGDLALARALERRAARNEKALVKLAANLAARQGPGELERLHELARIALVQGDLPKARVLLERLGPIAPENVQALLLKAVVDGDGGLAARTFGITTGSSLLDAVQDPAQLAAALKAALAMVLERPWDGRIELDTLEAIYPGKLHPNMVAMARVKEDPVGALLALVRSGDRVPPQEKKTLAQAAGLLLEIHPDEVTGRLQEAGMTPDEVKAAIALSGVRVEAPAEAPPR